MKIHILGIAGTMTAPLAVELKKQGHTVSGSDQEKIYPPISTLLQRNHIPLNTQPVNDTVDLFIIGSSFRSFSQTKKEFAEIKKLHFPYISATRFITKNIGRKNTILVAGAYGKTTISSLLVWVLTKLGLNPSYMFGGFSLNRIPSLKITNSDWAVIEADESINGLDTKAKFLYYPVRHLIVTSCDWEHKESYPTAEANLEAFSRLIKHVPKTGLIVYRQQSSSLPALVNQSTTPSFPYQLPSDHKFATPLLGDFNQENIEAVLTLCRLLGFNEKNVVAAISSYKGIARRLQLLSSINSIYFYDDFSQSPLRIKSSIEAIKNHHPDCQIKVFLEPHATFLQNTLGLNNLAGALSQVSEIVLSRIKFSGKIPPSDRVTLKSFKHELKDKLIYLPLYTDICQHYHQTLKPHTVLVHFSSGGKEGLETFKRIINNLKSTS
ncbi:MAG: Mur ligase domain-containing protein [Candidatus Shapirobacteria bacterium]|jgi:UDP-N-acetylmuramate: L-alanyl-gamma-D-glutamyl-meso-diaminopimelate ligase